MGATSEPVLCPSCDSEWPDEIRYCGACGARMPEATLVTGPARSQFEASEPPPKPIPIVPAPVTTPEGPLPQLPRSLLAGLMGSDPNTLPENPPTPVPHVEIAPKLPELVVAEVMSVAWQLAVAKLPIWLIGTAIVALASSVLSATVIGIALVGPLWGGLAIAAVRQIHGHEIVLDDFFKGVRAFVPLMVAGLVMTLGVSLGLALLVVPGLFVAVVTMYAPFFIIDRGLDGVSALRASYDAVMRQLGAHVALCVVLGLANVGGAALCGVGALFTIPFAVLSLGVAYGRVVGFTHSSE
jgi:hypothetical protein